MNKTTLAESIAQQTGLSKANAKEALNATLNAITEALSSGEKVTLIKFGTFGVSKRAERTAKVPSTGKEVKIPSMNVVKFKSGTELKNAINRG